MGLMRMIGESIDSCREWAYSEPNPIKAGTKGFVAGFVDGWEYSCLIIGNIVCAAGLIVWILGLFKKNNKED